MWWWAPSKRGCWTWWDFPLVDAEFILQSILIRLWGSGQRKNILDRCVQVSGRRGHGSSQGCRQERVLWCMRACRSKFWRTLAGNPARAMSIRLSLFQKLRSIVPVVDLFRQEVPPLGSTRINHVHHIAQNRSNAKEHFLPMFTCCWCYFHPKFTVSKYHPSVECIYFHNISSGGGGLLLTYLPSRPWC